MPTCNRCGVFVRVGGFPRHNQNCSGKGRYPQYNHQHSETISRQKATEAALQASRAEQRATEAELQASRAEQRATEAELQASRAELQAMRAELDAMRAEQRATEAELVATREKLRTTNPRFHDRMRLFKVIPGPTAQQGYDSYDSMVCWAQSAEAARNIYPNDNYRTGWVNDKWDIAAWDKPENLIVEEVTYNRGDNKILCASYNAG